jgi:IS5 family transposase
MKPHIPVDDKKTYRTTNWSDYNQALINRGNLTFWIDPNIKWHADPNGKSGRDHTFSDIAIQTCLTIKVLLNLPLRQTQGFMQSIITLAKLDWEAPNYSTLSRRGQNISISIPCQPAPNGLHLLIDSTGIKIVGAGEWCYKKHGKQSPRQWRKVHIGIDADSQQIRAVGVTTNNVGDPSMLDDLLEQIPDEEQLRSVTADGAYDTRKCHYSIADREAQAIIPPRSNAVIWQPAKHKGDRVRNEAVRRCDELTTKLWKQRVGYHRRSLVETAMFRLKRLGDRLMARRFDTQVTEVHIRIAVLNKWTSLGMPVTVAV